MSENPDPSHLVLAHVVLDANIYVSALLKPSGLQSQLLQKGLEGEFQIVISEKIFLELCRTEKAFAGLNYEKIGDKGCWVKC